MTDKRQPATVYLGLGSNLGDRLHNLRQAIELLDKQLVSIRDSSVYETEPVGVPSQPKFLNMVIEGRTNLTPEDLLIFVKGIEQEMGRGTANSEEPRPIDIDILFYDNLSMATRVLVIPHPRLSQRAFVLKPLNDLAPELKHSLTNKTVTEMLSALDNVRGVELYSRSLPVYKPNSERTRGTAMYYVSIKDHFDAAHFLRGYAGKCENVHGHRSEVSIKLSSSTLNAIGLAYDFTELKAVLRPVLGRFDHTMLNDVPPFDSINPSAENIARAIYDEIKPKIAGAALESVTIWESPESSAEYRAD
jgi:2-amino-4-hydroxy-6-hydroxymethyldihydropteridine diphosphokinase/queuosine biosynthesis protein QueD